VNLRFPANPDAYQDVATTEAAANAAEALLLAFHRLGVEEPHVGPLANGGLQIEWNHQAGYIEFAVMEDGNITVFVE